MSTGTYASVLVLVDQLVGADPRHHRAQLGAGLLDRVRRRGLARGLELGLAGAVVEHEVLDEAARLDVGQDALHFLLRFVSDDTRTTGYVAVFGRVADRVAHVGN